MSTAPSYVLGVLERIAATPGKLDKLAILKEYANDGVFRTVCQLAYEPSLNFYISRPAVMPENTLQPNVPYDLEAALNDLLLFSKGDIRGNEQRDYLNRILHLSTPSNAEVICRILDRDLHAGFNVSSCNKTWTGLISTFEFMLADTDPSNIVYPAESQLKADGIRAKLHIASDIERVTAISRQGKPIEIFDFFDREGLALVDSASADLDGEFVCYDGDKPLSRKISNGILNKAIKGTVTKEEASMIRFLVWDIDDPEQIHDYEQRFNALKRQIENHDIRRIILIESRRVNSVEEATAHFKEVRRRGLEGTIVKNLKSKWVPKRTKDQAKFKAEVEAEFKVVGYELGTGKNKNRIGALFIETECKKVRSKVGIFKDMDESVRDDLLVAMPPVVTVLYNERITDKSRKDGTESLFLPRVTQLRWDKNIANTREELIQIEKAILEG